MANNIKQIYVSLQMCENEIRILVGEYFNTRFNIIRSEKYPTSSISDFKITNREELVKDIKNAVKDCSDKIGAQIEQVILVLPAYNFKRYPLQSRVIPDNGIVKREDIARAVSNSLKASCDPGVMVVNPVIIRYNVNGITTRRLPEKEVCDELGVEIDLLCADIEMCYEYVSVLEEADLKVLDITLNNYAIAKEAALLEESLNRNIVILDVEKSCTCLTLLSKGKLASSEIIYDGLNSMINSVYRKLNMPYNDICKLVKYCVNFSSEYPDDIVYAWSDQGTTKTITTAQLNETVKEPLNALSDKLLTMCKPIIETGAMIVLTGEGQQMRELANTLKEGSYGQLKTYYPDTIGVRDPSFTALYGAFFVYRDKVLLNNLDVNCIDLLTYDSLIDQRELDSEGETITSRIRNLFRQYIG